MNREEPWKSSHTSTCIVFLKSEPTSIYLVTNFTKAGTDLELLRKLTPSVASGSGGICKRILLTFWFKKGTI